jgi:hypothetical protein
VKEFIKVASLFKPKTCRHDGHIFHSMQERADSRHGRDKVVLPKLIGSGLVLRITDKLQDGQVIATQVQKLHVQEI